MTKGLEALKIIENAPTFYVDLISDIHTRHSYECKQIEKELKVLEIIKNKNPNIWIFKNTNSLTAYNEGCLTHEQLSQEEYNLMKGVIK